MYQKRDEEQKAAFRSRVANEVEVREREVKANQLSTYCCRVVWTLERETQ